MYKLILQSAAKAGTGTDEEVWWWWGLPDGWMDAACTEDWKPAVTSVHRTEKRLLLPWMSAGAEENTALLLPPPKKTRINSARFISRGMHGVTVSQPRQAPFIE